MALLVALFFSPWLYGELPRPVRTLIFLIGVFPVLRVYTLLAPQPLRASFVALTAFFVLERLDDIAAVVPLLNQLVFLAEMVAGHHAHRGDPGLVPPSRGRAVHARSCARSGSPCSPPCRRALLLAVFGYTRLGRLLGAGALSVGYYAMVFQALFRVALALLTYALRMRPLTYLRFIQLNRSIVEWRVGRFFWWLAVAGWVITSLANLGLFWKVYGTVAAVFDSHPHPRKPEHLRGRCDRLRHHGLAVLRRSRA